MWLDLQIMDGGSSWIPPAPFLSGKKWSLDLFGTRPWAEFEPISWKWSILSDIPHLNSSKGKENSIWNWSGRNIHTYSVCLIPDQLDVGSQFSFWSLWRPAQIYWRRVVDLSHSQKNCAWSWPQSHLLTHHESGRQTWGWDGALAKIESLLLGMFPWGVITAKPDHVSHFSFCLLIFYTFKMFLHIGTHVLKPKYMRS